MKVFDAMMNRVVSGVETVEGADHVRRIDVGDEVAVDAGVDVVAQRLVHHHRPPQIRAADTDVHHVGDAFPGVALPFSAAELVGELAHPGEDLVHVGDDVLSVDGQRRVRGGESEGGVQDARSSEVLMCAPANMSSRLSSSPTSRARLISSSSVSRVTRCLE